MNKVHLQQALEAVERGAFNRFMQNVSNQGVTLDLTKCKSYSAAVGLININASHEGAFYWREIAIKLNELIPAL